MKRRIWWVVGGLAVGLSALMVYLLCDLRARGHDSSENQSLPVADKSRPLPMRYAENIQIEVLDEGGLTGQQGYRVTLLDPWHKGRALHRYMLIPRGRTWNGDTQETIVRIPLKRSVVFNTAHASLLCMLGAVGQMVGVADLKYMLLPEVHHRVQQGEIVDCGNAMAPDIERIIQEQADAILLSPFENSGGYGRLEQVGIPLIECADYMETSALGRAEWMLFYGLLYGKYSEAYRLFEEIEQQYHALSHRAMSMPRERSIITEKLTGNIWYVAGGRSSVGQLIADAGGRYAWTADGHSGSLALTFEQVLDQAGDADVWVFNDMGQQPPTYSQLSSEYYGYTQLRAFRNRNVWYVNSLQVPYFEEVSFRPDWLLGDYVRILHPDLHLSGAPRYFRKVVDN